jgi:hypothetical protein
MEPKTIRTTAIDAASTGAHRSSAQRRSSRFIRRPYRSPARLSSQRDHGLTTRAVERLGAVFARPQDSSAPRTYARLRSRRRQQRAMPAASTQRRRRDHRNPCDPSVWRLVERPTDAVVVSLYGFLRKRPMTIIPPETSYTTVGGDRVGLPNAGRGPVRSRPQHGSMGTRGLLLGAARDRTFPAATGLLQPVDPVRHPAAALRSRAPAAPLTARWRCTTRLPMDRLCRMRTRWAAGC